MVGGWRWEHEELGPCWSCRGAHARGSIVCCAQELIVKMAMPSRTDEDIEELSQFKQGTAAAELR